MKRFIIATALALSLLSPFATVARAESYDWVEDTSKQGLDGFYVCTGVAEFGGNKGSITHNVGPDESQPRASEMRWQVAYCERITRDDMVNLWKYRWNQDIDPSIVKISGGFH